jgi:hypothetical protein
MDLPLTLFTAALVLLATARLVRLLLVDELGLQLRTPLEIWLTSKSPVSRYWLIDGLGCPWCVGFWIGLGVLGVSPFFLLAAAPAWLTMTWYWLMAGLSLNYLVGHLYARLDYSDPQDDEGALQ